MIFVKVFWCALLFPFQMTLKPTDCFTQSGFEFETPVLSSTGVQVRFYYFDHLPPYLNDPIELKEEANLADRMKPAIVFCKTCSFSMHGS